MTGFYWRLGVLTVAALGVAACVADDSWCALGAALFGAMLGLIASLVAFVWAVSDR